MNRRILGLGACAATFGALALVLTPRGPAAPGALASAGSDIPVWAFVVVGSALLLGLLFIILGSRRRREDEEEVPADAAAEEPRAEAAEDAAVADDPTDGSRAATDDSDGSHAVADDVTEAPQTTPRPDADPR